MNQEVSPRKRKFLQFPLSSLFWLTLVVAAFFSGRAWDDFVLRMSSLLSTSGTKTNLTLRTGGSTVITKGGPKIPQAQVNDPSVCSLTPLSPTSVQLTGLTPGKTVVNVWYDDQTCVPYQIVVRK